MLVFLHMPFTVEEMQNECLYGCIFITIISTLNMERCHNIDELNPPFIFLSCLPFIIFSFSLPPPVFIAAV